MSVHKDIHGDDMTILKSSYGNIWITCNEQDASVTELCFSKSTVEKIIEDLQNQLEEQGHE